MTRINIGISDKHNIYIDLDVLLRTRLLIQANSGGGKSRTIRRLVEQAFGKILISATKPVLESVQKAWTVSRMPINAKKQPLPAISRQIATPTKQTKNQNPVENSDEYVPNGPEQRILDAIAWFESIGQENPKQTGVAFLAGYSYGGGAFNNPRGHLNKLGWVRYLPDDRIGLTEQGRTFANSPVVPLTIDEMQSHVYSILPGPEESILEELISIYPESIDKEELSARCNRRGGAFNNPLGRLRSLGLIDYPEPGRAVALPVLFLEN